MASSLIWSIPLLHGHMTSSTKPEVHKVSHFRQKRNEPQPQETIMYRKFGEIWTCIFIYANEQTDRRTIKQTDTLITVLRIPTGAK